MERKIYGLVFSLLLMTVIAGAEIRRVPQHYSTIQAAINAAVHGDTVLVEPGTYFENVKFRGKRILVASRFIVNHDEAFIRNTVINGSRPQHPDTASCVLLINREDSTAVLAGFTLTGGRGTRWLDEHGAGYYWEGGGGIWVNNSLVGSRLPSLIENNTIIGNSSSGALTTPIAARGGALLVSNNANVVARNNILWANTQAQGGPVFTSGAALVLSYSAIESGYAGTGNIAVYPAFADSGYYLTANSPGVDAGDSSPYYNDPNFTRAENIDSQIFRCESAIGRSRLFVPCGLNCSAMLCEDKKASQDEKLFVLAG